MPRIALADSRKEALPFRLKSNQQRGEFIHKEHSLVRFPDRKISSLSGADKVELMRDLIATKSPLEALRLWRLVLANGLANQLVYKYLILTPAIITVSYIC